MAEYTLAEVFGAGATQDINVLTIQKSSLPGLTADSANSAESLLVALLVLWINGLTETNRISDEISRQVAVTDAGTDITVGNTGDFLRRSYAVSLYKVFEVPTLDPDDY